MPGEAPGIEKRVSIPIAGKFSFDGGQSIRITRKLACQVFIFANRCRDEFGKPDRVQKAAGHPRSKGFSRIGDYG